MNLTSKGVYHLVGVSPPAVVAETWAASGIYVVFLLEVKADWGG